MHQSNSFQNSVSASPGRVDWVDYAKGICILLVVMMHSTLGVEKAAGTTGWLGYVVEFSKPFRMPDFFVISGLFLGLVINRPWIRYLDRKVVHFIYFYVLWLTIQFVFKAPSWVSEGLGVGGVIANYLLAFIEPFGTLWFIYMLPVFFIVTRLTKSLPWWSVIGVAALLEILPIHTGWLMIDEFASRYVYFLAGYMFAVHIFLIANWVQKNIPLCLGLLVAWAIINAVIVFAPVNGSFQALMVYMGFELNSYAQLPFISLALGGAGAMAIIVISVLLSDIKGSEVLEYLGRNSIVVYLAFFLPMAITRVVLLKIAPFLDVGTISLLTMIAAASGPVIFYMIIQRFGYGKFLFHRPAWAIIDTGSNSSKVDNKAKLHPAE